MTEQNLPSAMANAIAQEIQKFEQSEQFLEMVSSKVQKMLSEAIDDALGWCSDFKKSIDEAIKNAMPADISDALDLSKYNTLLAQTVKSTWDSSAISDHAGEKARDMVLDFIKSYEVPKYITMTELMQAFISENEYDQALSAFNKAKSSNE